LYARGIKSLGDFQPVCGGGGRVYGRGPDGLYLTTNGRTFSKVTLPTVTNWPPNTNAYNSFSGATAGNRTIINAAYVSGVPLFGFSAVLASTNGGAFTNFALPDLVGDGTLISDGSSLFYYILSSGYPGNSVTTIWNGINGWTKRATITNAPSGLPVDPPPSFARSTNNISLLNHYATGLLRSTNNGTTWSKVSGAPFGPLAFGNGSFVIMASNGVYRSPGTSGTTWTKVSSYAPGDRALAFTNGAFLSGTAASRDGSFWLPYRGTAGVSNPETAVLGGGTNLIFISNYQASTNFVPSVAAGSQRVNVGTAVNIPLQTY
jgi:hypothetical protein